MEPPPLASSDEEDDVPQRAHSAAQGQQQGGAQQAPPQAQAAPPAAQAVVGAAAAPPPANAAQANAIAVDAAVAAALAAADEAEEGDEVAEIRLGKRFPIAFPALLLGHVALHWLDRVKTEAQLHQHSTISSAINSILTTKGAKGWTEGWLPAVTESILKVFMRMYIHSVVSNWLRDRYYNGDRNRKLGGLPLVISSAVIATTESILLTSPLQLLKLRHMNTRAYVPFRSILYECLFAKPPTVLYHGFLITWVRQLFNHITWWVLWEGTHAIPGISRMEKTPQQLLVTAITGLAMAAITNPIEVLKTNVQRWWSGLELRLCAAPISQLVAWLLVECTSNLRRGDQALNR